MAPTHLEEPMVDIIRVNAAALERDVAALFHAAGVGEEHAAEVAASLVGANLAGHDSHGVVLAPLYLQAIADGSVDAAGEGVVSKDAPGLLVVDGGHGFGQVVGRRVMARAIEKARGGHCLVALRRSFHLGRIGEWAEICAAAGLVSVHFVNVLATDGIVAPFGGRARRMSTNPFTVGVPVPGGPPVILDMATSRIAAGKVRVAANAGKPAPEGALIDAEGRPTTDPNSLYADPPGALLHFGEHKGYGLAFVCDLLAGALAGGGTRRPENDAPGRVLNGMFSILVDPAAIDPAVFGIETAAFVDWMRACPPVDPTAPVLAPGDPERATRAERAANGIPIDATTLADLAAAAARLGVVAPSLAP
jgi:uncharacterized oxidoreductase